MDVYICRHGETAWSLSGKHTSFTDLSLTDGGELEAKRLGEKLKSVSFDEVFTSPLKRARETCTLAGFEAEVWDDLFEWNYGDYEGLTTPEIRKSVPDWTIFDYGAPGGESVEDVEARANGVVEKLKQMEGRILLFTSGHFSRVLAARWVGLPASGGRYLITSTATVGILGFSREEPVIQCWNCSS